MEGLENSSFSTGQVSKLLDVPIGTLQQWDARGVLPVTHVPHGSTTRRRYTVADVYAAGICRTLAGYGFRDEALACVRDAIVNKSDRELEKMRLVMLLEPTGRPVEKADETEVERTFFICADEESFKEALAIGCTLQLNFLQYVQGVHKRIKEMGLDVPPRRTEH